MFTNPLLDVSHSHPVDPGGAALLIWATAHMIAFFEQLGAHGGRFDPKIIRAAVKCLWQGLAPKD